MNPFPEFNETEQSYLNHNESNQFIPSSSKIIFDLDSILEYNIIRENRYHWSM